MDVMLKSKENIGFNIKKFSKDFIEKNYVQNAFMSKEVKIEKMELDLKKIFDGLESSLQEGLINLFRKLEVVNPEEYQYFKTSLNFSDEKWTELIEQKEIESGNIYRIIGMSKENINVLYEIACKLYEEENYEDSRTSFLVLIVLNNLDYRFWLGEGLSLQAQKNFEEALIFLIVATTLHTPLPIAHVAIGECLNELNRFSEACSHFEIAKDSMEEGDLKNYCQDLINQIKNKVVL
jgi:tetratricopeptide (TPR) repeat protein